MSRENKTRETLINMYLKSLEEGIIPWNKPWNANRNHLTGKDYKGVNQMLLNAVATERNYESNEWLTMNQIQTLHEKEAKEAQKLMEENLKIFEPNKELLDSFSQAISISYKAIKTGNPNTYLNAYNQTINKFKKDHPEYKDSLKTLKEYDYVLENAKGHGVPVEFFSPYNIRTKKKISFSEYNRIFSEASEEIRNDLIFLVENYYVFNTSLVHGLKKKLNQQKQEGFSYEIHDKIAYTEYANMIIDQYAKEEGIQIDEVAGSGTAYYSPDTDRIHLPSRHQFVSLEAFVSTKAHECIHSTGHRRRLNREFGKFMEDPLYAKEELRAEIGASFLCSDLGIAMSEFEINNHKAYIQSYISLIKEKNEELFRAINDAQKACDYVKEKGGYDRVLEEQKANETKLAQSSSRSF